MVKFAVVVVASPVLNLAFARKHSDLQFFHRNLRDGCGYT
jgi:hypothetical protein